MKIYLLEREHGFAPQDSGVLMTDWIRYALPFGWLGRATHALAVRSALAAIFDYRFARIQTLLDATAPSDGHG